MKTTDVCGKLPYRGFQLFIITGIFFSLFAFDVFGQRAPNSLTALTVTAISSTSLRVSWSAPDNDGGSPITGYTVYYYPEADNTDVTYIANLPITPTSKDITGLDANTTYKLSAAAENAIGEGGYLAEITGTTWPAAPAAPTVTATSSTTLSVTWTAPGGPAAITDYDVQYRVGSSGGFTDASYTGTGTSTTLSSLQSGTAYEVQVRATNSGGTGAWSSSGSGTTTAAAAPDKPAAPTVVATPGSTTSLDISWTAPANNGADISDYDVQYRVGSSGGFTDAGYDGTGISTTISTLQSGTTYEVQVQAKNSAGSSGWSTAGTGTTNAPTVTVPGAPTITAVTPLSTTSLRVTWDPPSNTGGAQISGYEFQYRGQGGTYSSWSDTDSDTTHVITGLRATTTYEVQVRAENSEGPGSASTATGTTLSPDDPPPPDNAPAPPNVQLSDSNPQTTFILTWLTYTQDGQSATDYDVQYRTKNPGHWIDLPHDGTTTQTLLANLRPGTLYEIQIRAKTANGMSPWSSSAEGKTAARGARVQPCPVGWHPWNHAQRTQRAFIHAVEVDMNLTDPRGAYQVVAIEIYVDLDTDPETLAGWKLSMTIPYNTTRLEYLLTAENSEIIYFANPELGGIARIEVPEATPFPITNLTYIGQVLPGFDYRLFDENNMRVDFGISCYRGGGLTARLSVMQIPRVERKLKIADVDWQAPYYFSEWTVPGAVPAAPAAVKQDLVTSWAELKRQILEKE